MLRKADGTLIEKQVGQKAMAESLPVVLASDQNDLPVTLAGEAVIIGGQPISVNAAITGQPINTSIAASDSAGIDAFGRWRTSGTGNRYDSEYIYNKQPLLVDEVISGGATATHNADSRDVTLAIVNATNATSAAHYSHIDVPYTPGNSQLVDVTGTLNLAGIAGGLTQLFVRTSVTGSVVTTTYDQASWTNPVADVNWATSQILSIDFQSLKVGRIRFNLVRGGGFVKLHEVTNDNVRAGGYWQSPSLPIYWRIYNDATYTYAEMGYGDTANGVGIRHRLAANAGATMRAICATVKSEGGVILAEMPGLPFSADRNVTPVTVSTTLIPIVSIRVAALFNGIVNRAVYIPEGFSIAGDNPMRYAILYRPTLTNASWNAVDAAYSGMEFDVAATAISGGVRVDSDYFVTGRNVSSNVRGTLGRLTMALGRTGTSDILSLAAIRTGTTNSSAFGAISWREIK